MAEIAQNDVDSGSPADSINPWMNATQSMMDPTHAAALRGLPKAVAQGMPVKEGVQRLKKLGVPQQHIDEAVATLGHDQSNEHPSTQSNITSPMPGQEVGMNAPEQQAGSQPSVVSLSGEKNQDTDTNKWQTQSTQFQLPPADVLKAKQLLASGITPGTAKNAQGEDRYQQKADAIGRPLYTDLNGDPTPKPFEMDPKTGERIEHKPIFDTAKPVYDFSRNETDPNHPVQQQLGGLQRIQDLLKMEGEQRGRQPLSMGVNLTPLAKLADYENAKSGIKTDNAAGYVAPETSPQMRDRFLAYQQQLQKDRGEIQKGIYENMKTMGGGTIQDLLSAQQANQSNTSLQDTINKMGQMKDQQDYNRAQMIHARNVQGLKQDPNIGKQLMSVNSMKNAFDLLTQYPTPQTFHDAQQAVRNVSTGLTGGSKSGVEERASTYMPSIERDWANLRQSFGNNVQKVPANDPQMIQLKQDLELLHRGVAEEMAKQAIARTGGYDYIYNDPRFGDPLKKSLASELANYTGGGPLGQPTQGMSRGAIAKSGKMKPSTNQLPPGASQAQAGGMIKIVGAHQYKKVNGGWELIE